MTTTATPHLPTALPPGPTGPGLLQVLKFVRTPYRFMDDCRARHGDTFTVRFPGQPPIVVCGDPDALSWLATAGYEQCTRQADNARFILGDASILFRQDDQHRSLRRLMTPPFHGERMRDCGTDIAAIADARFARWRPGETVALMDEIEAITLRVIVRCIFGIDEHRVEQLERDILGYLHGISKPWYYAGSLLLSGPRVRGFVRSFMPAAGRRRPWRLQTAEHLAGFEAGLVEEVRRCRAMPADALGRRRDVLSMLASARFDDGSEFGEEELKDHLMTMLLAGYNASAITACWAVHDLLSHPEALSRLREEVCGVEERAFDPGRLRDVPYLTAAMNESMRYHPLAPWVVRKLKQPAVFGGHPLPAGAQVAPCIYLAHRDPRLWPDPDRFQPDRFLTGRITSQQYMPFGLGVWRCLGAPFAEYMVKVMLYRLFARFELEPEADVTIRPVLSGIAVAPSHGMPVRVVRRLY